MLALLAGSTSHLSFKIKHRFHLSQLSRTPFHPIHQASPYTRTTTMDETYTQLPLRMDPSSKAISSTIADDSNAALQDELVALNQLHRSVVGLESAVPPPPVPVNPKRSAQINKLRESGNASFRKGSYADAIRMYTFGLEMALGRPPWEPAGLVRDEVAGLYANRAQAYMAMQSWAEAMVDAGTSVEMKRVGNAKGWWRRGKCLLEMGRLDEAKDWVGRALEFEGNEPDLVALMKEIENLMERREEKDRIEYGEDPKVMANLLRLRVVAAPRCYSFHQRALQPSMIAS